MFAGTQAGDDDLDNAEPATPPAQTIETLSGPGICRNCLLLSEMGNHRVPAFEVN